MTHIVELVIKRFYRVYVEDEDNSMTEAQIIENAKRQAVEDENNLTPSDGMDIEPDDIVAAEYQDDID